MRAETGFRWIFGDVFRYTDVHVRAAALRHVTVGYVRALLADTAARRALYIGVIENGVRSHWREGEGKYRTESASAEHR